MRKGRALTEAYAQSLHALATHTANRADFFADVIDPTRQAIEGAELRRALDSLSRQAHNVISLLDVGARR